MSTKAEIKRAVEKFDLNNLCIKYATSTYPAKYEELNLNVIKNLRKEYKCEIGYSGHETGIATSVAAVALGATMIERHITLDRSMFGSDQSASLGPSGFRQLCRDIRILEEALEMELKSL